MWVFIISEMNHLGTLSSIFVETMLYLPKRPPVFPGNRFVLSDGLRGAKHIQPANKTRDQVEVGPNQWTLQKPFGKSLAVHSQQLQDLPAALVNWFDFMVLNGQQWNWHKWPEHQMLPKCIDTCHRHTLPSSITPASCKKHPNQTNKAA